MEENNKLGNNIRILREIKGLTQKEMAVELDMSISGYNKIERGETDVAYSRLQRIAEILKADISQILNLDKSLSFHFNNTGDATGIGTLIQNQYVSQPEEMNKMLNLLQQQMNVLTDIIKRKQ